MNLALPSFLPFGQLHTPTAEERQENHERAALLQRVRQCVKALNTERGNYGEITDPDLIDAHIYHVMSLEAQYRFLLRQARDTHLTADTPDALLS